MFDITNNPVNLTNQKYNQDKDVQKMSSFNESQKSTSMPPQNGQNQNLLHRQTPPRPQNPEIAPIPPRPDFKEAGIEPINTNPSGMNTITKMILTATIIFVLGHIGFFFFYMANIAQIKTLETNYLNAQKKLSDLKPVEDKANAIIAANTELKAYYNERIDWKKLWNQFNSKMLKQSQINSFSMDEKGAISFSGQTDSLTNLAKNIVSFKSSSTITNLKLTGTSFSTDEEGKIKVTYSMTGQVDLSQVRMGK